MEVGSFPELLVKSEDCRLELFKGEPFAPNLEEHFADNAKMPRTYFYTPPEIRPVFLHKIVRVVYTRLGYILKQGRDFSSENIFPQHVARDNKQFGESFEFETDRESHSSGFIFLHRNWATYGHFLIEMLPKLKIYAELRKFIPGLPLLLPENAPLYVSNWINFYLGEAKIVRIKTHATIVEAYVPDMLVTYYAFGRAMYSFLSDCIEKSAASTVNRARYLLISRKKRRQSRADFRCLTNYEALETAMAPYGFQIVEPDILDLGDQIALFAGAKIIVGELGSGLHNTVFSAAGTIVVQINPFNSVQRLIAISCRHTLASILPDDGIIRPWPLSPEIPPDFSVSPSRVVEALLPHLPPAAPSKPA